MNGSFNSSSEKLNAPYKANHSRGKTFAVGCRIHDSLENICGKVVCRLTPINFFCGRARGTLEFHCV